MMKKILAAAFVALSLTAFNSNAQALEKNCCQNKTECNAKTQKCTDNNTACRKDKGLCQQAFGNLNLSEDQQNRLQQLDKQRAENRRCKAEARKEQRRCSDSTARAERRAEKQRYLKEVKNILGSEKYVLFLENIYDGR